MCRKCHTCLCQTCLSVCAKCMDCKRKIEFCDNYSGFRQMSIFEQSLNPQSHSVPRHSWKYYDISKARYRQLTEYIQSGRYTVIASQAAHTANEMIAEYILLSVIEHKSYEGLEKMWARGEIDRIPYGKTDFYGIRRYFYHLFDLEVRRIGK